MQLFTAFSACMSVSTHRLATTGKGSLQNVNRAVLLGAIETNGRTGFGRWKWTRAPDKTACVLQQLCGWGVQILFQACLQGLTALRLKSRHSDGLQNMRRRSIEVVSTKLSGPMLSPVAYGPLVTCRLSQKGMCLLAI